MDTTFPDSALRWRAITDPSIQTAAYWLIIAAEIVVALVLWLGVLRVLANIGRPDFSRATATAVTGLTLGFLLYSVGFVAVGGEWFAMWQSEIWSRIAEIPCPP
jgi:predicted small integral membrane protein